MPMGQSPPIGTTSTPTWTTWTTIMRIWTEPLEILERILTITPQIPLMGARKGLDESIGHMKLEPPAKLQRKGFPPEVFLDRIDLSKTVDRHGMERYHVLSRSSRFFAAILLERQPVLAKNG